MDRPKRDFKQSTMELATDFARGYVDATTRAALNYANDPEKRDRLADSQCIRCWYQESRIGGAAITHSPCGICGKEMSFANTNTDTLCKECAMGAALCRHCGADVQLRPRRKYP